MGERYREIGQHGQKDGQDQAVNPRPPAPPRQEYTAWDEHEHEPYHAIICSGSAKELCSSLRSPDSMSERQRARTVAVVTKDEAALYRHLSTWQRAVLRRIAPHAGSSRDPGREVAQVIARRLLPPLHR